MEDASLSTLISKGYEILNLITFFTSGLQESRAWSIKKGTQAPDAAGKIHTDFKIGFIKAEVISYDDFVEFGGEAKCKENGKLKALKRTYEIVDDGGLYSYDINLNPRYTNFLQTKKVAKDVSHNKNRIQHAGKMRPGK